jgi:hypothetical protein
MKARVLGVALAVLLPGAAALAQPVCSGFQQLMSWPDTDPVWQFCWLRPVNSSGPNGSGLEISDVYYDGHLVLKRGHVPIVNVIYPEGGCGPCYRDWMDQEQAYLSNNILAPGYSEPTSPCPQTVCEYAATLGDCPSLSPPATCVGAVCFNGVAAEKLSDRLIMTAQTTAGWYRYTMRWIFYLDGRFEPFFGFTAVGNPCPTFPHIHHAYWRLDFDIDGPDNDVVSEGPNPSGGGRSGPRYPTVNLPTEAMRKLTRPGQTWAIADSVTRRGFRLVPGTEASLPADAFAVGDVWVLKYKSNEIDDTGQSGPPCAIKFNNYVNGEGLGQDLVFWYRTGAYHEAGDLDDCHTVGPTLYPFGDWSPSPGLR